MDIDSVVSEGSYLLLVETRIRPLRHALSREIKEAKGTLTTTHSLNHYKHGIG